jgi:hypothetical protein
MAAPLPPQFRVALGTRPRSSCSTTSSYPPRGTRAARVIPRRALQTGGSGCVALRAARLPPPTAATARRRCAPGPIRQLTVAGVRVHFPRHSTAPHAPAAAGAFDRGDGGGGNGSGGEQVDRGASAAPTPSPLDGPGETFSSGGRARASRGATAGPLQHKPRICLPCFGVELFTLETLKLSHPSSYIIRRSTS